MACEAIAVVGLTRLGGVSRWHVDWVLMWGSPESLREIKALVNLIEQAQAQIPQTEGGAGATPTGTQAQPPRPAGSPFAS